MLKDRPRTETYRAAISAAIAKVAQERYAAAELGMPAPQAPIRLLDVGCGTGILCMFAAAAARQQQVPIQIFAVEGSGMADVARRLIAENGFGDVVTVIHGAVEVVSLPGCDGPVIDILVSEWMGFYLLHESMLNSVLVARDRWLRPGGLMLPSHATIFAAPLSLERSLGWWKDVYGFDYSSVSSQVLEDTVRHNPKCDNVVDPADVMAEGQVVASIDCTSCSVDSLLGIRRPMRWLVPSGAPVHGLVFWFDCAFPAPPASMAGGPAADQDIILRTGPAAPKTHWHQTVVNFGADVLPGAGSGGQTAACDPSGVLDRFDCVVELRADPSAPRSYAITVELVEADHQD
jgi:SAM-dependent methyltransferase